MCTLVGTAVALGDDAFAKQILPAINKKNISLSSESISPTVSAPKQTSVWKKMNTASKVTTAMAISAESLALVRSVGSAIPSVGPQNPMIHNLGYATGGLGLILGTVVTIPEEVQNLKASRRVGDGEGERRAAVGILGGAISSAASALFLTRLAYGAGILGLTLAMNSLSAMAAAIKIGTWGVFGYRSHIFHSHFSKIIQDPTKSEKERLIAGIEFLQSKFALMPTEKSALILDLEKKHGHLSAATKRVLLNRKLMSLAKTKVEHLKRRIGLDAVQKIAADSQRLLIQLRTDSNNPRYCQEARAFTREIWQANSRQIRLFAVAGTVAAIALAGLITGTVLSLGFLSYCFAAMVAAGGLLSTVAPLMNDKDAVKEKLAYASLSMVPALSQ